MDTNKEKIQLTGVQETLLTPLYCKAQEGNPFFDDPKAREVMGRIQYDLKKIAAPKKTCVTLCMRAKQIDRYTSQFLTRHPDGVVVHLGCGLDSRCARVQQGYSVWYDLDFPDVIELRRKFYTETDTYHMIGSSVNDLAWINSVTAHGRPVIVLAEGLLMYLTEEQVKSLVLTLKQTFPGCHLAFDAFSTLTARHVKAHPMLRETGASVYWGIDDPAEIEHWAEGIRLKEEWFFNQSEDLSKLDPLFRWIFKFASLFPVARKAQRLLYYTL